MTIRVRRIRPDDAKVLRRVRLAALAEAPDSFWQTFDSEAARPLAGWRARAVRNSAGDAHATFLVVAGGSDPDDDVVGMVDVYQPSLAPEFRELAAMWAAPQARGRGAAAALLDAAVDWAREAGAIGVRLWVVPSNPAAVRVYSRHGFEQVGDPEPDDTYSAGKVYVPMLLVLDQRAAESSTYLSRALAPWTDESG